MLNQRLMLSIEIEFVLHLNRSLFAAVSLMVLLIGMALCVTADSYWYSQPCGSQTILRGVHFINTQKGWVVGNDGTILTTQNGGQQ